MPITVVTHRDDVGAPTNREVFAAAGSWRRGPNGLEIVSLDRRVIATYPDGNWLSIYVDNRVRVHTQGRPEEEPVPRMGGAPVAARSGAGSVSPARDGGAAVAARTRTSDDEVLVPDEILPAEQGGAPESGDDFDAAFPDVIDADALETDALETDALETEPDDTETVGAEPATSVAAADEPAAPKPAAASKASADELPPRTNLPPGMRPVAFRARAVRPARRPEEPKRPTPMRPLVFRAKTYRKPDQ